jgi:uncharacterized protein
MDPSFNYRRAQTRAADLHRQADLHRLARRARARNARARSRFAQWLRCRTSGRVMHLDARDVPSREIRQAKTILLTTYKRDGSGVDTPVSIGFDGDRAFFRTWHEASKSTRLARNSSVTVAPSTVRAKTIGPALSAQARLLEAGDAQLAARALARRHPFLQRLLVPVTHRLMRYRTLHYELLWDRLSTETGLEDVQPHG